MKKIYLKMIAIFLVLMGYSVINAIEEPKLVFSTLSAGTIIPEFIIDRNGSYKEATMADIWPNQLIKVYSQDANPKYITNILIKSKDDEQGTYLENSKLDSDEQYWGIFCKERTFPQKGLGKLYKPQKTAFKIEGLINSKQNNVKEILTGLVKKDFSNIKKDYPKLKMPIITEYMMGDFNGDKQKDFIVNIESSAIIVYTNKGKYLERTTGLAFWKNTTESWPRLFFAKDLNGDGNDEICIADCDGDTNIPIIYSWFKEKQGFMMVYKGRREFWQG